jgi:hypothetical protein
MEDVCKIGTHGFAIDEQLNMNFVRDLARKYEVGFGGNLKLTLALSLGLLSPREDAIVSLAAGGHIWNIWIRLWKPRNGMNNTMPSIRNLGKFNQRKEDSDHGRKNKH